MIVTKHSHNIEKYAKIALDSAKKIREKNIMLRATSAITIPSNFCPVKSNS